VHFRYRQLVVDLLNSSNVQSQAERLLLLFALMKINCQKL